MTIEFLVDIVLLGLLALTAIAIHKTRDLFASIMLTGIYSLLSALFFIVMDAVDVAFTEAAVGAGISTLLMLSCMPLVKKQEQPSRHHRPLGLVVVTLTGALLIYGTMDMPPFGSVDDPIQQHVAPRYLHQSMDEVGLPNVVTSVLASYRGFDTFGETVVILTAGIGVLALLGFRRSRAQEMQHRVPAMQQHMILRIISKLLIPPILIFAFYVQFHGDFGPGGGFQAGAIFAAAIILYTMLFGLSTARQVFRERYIHLLAAVGVLIYGAVGIASMLAGKNFLDYDALAANPLTGQHVGILLVELGVGITVAAVMIIIFYTFSGRLDKDDHKEPES